MDGGAVVEIGRRSGPGASAAEPTAKWCSGVKIAAFPGGPQGGVFANNVYNGFRQAEMDLGATVTYYFSDWDPNKMLQQIQQAVATKVDGIATYGFAGEPATGPIVDQAFAQGLERILGPVSAAHIPGLESRLPTHVLR